MTEPRAVVTTEAPTAPILLSLYSEYGLAGRIELSPEIAVCLAEDLLAAAVRKFVDGDLAIRQARGGGQ